jgi:hypothetical protein
MILSTPERVEWFRDGVVGLSDGIAPILLLSDRGGPLGVAIKQSLPAIAGPALMFISVLVHASMASSLINIKAAPINRGGFV